MPQVLLLVLYNLLHRVTAVTLQLLFPAPALWMHGSMCSPCVCACECSLCVYTRACFVCVCSVYMCVHVLCVCAHRVCAVYRCMCSLCSLRVHTMCTCAHHVCTCPPCAHHVYVHVCMLCAHRACVHVLTMCVLTMCACVCSPCVHMHTYTRPLMSSRGEEVTRPPRRKSRWSNLVSTPPPNGAGGRAEAEQGCPSGSNPMWASAPPSHRPAPAVPPRLFS